MKLACTEVFKKDFRKLPDKARKAAAKQITQLLIDHTHPRHPADRPRLGGGVESRVPMGVAIIGGLIVGTVLTLYVVPAMYSYVSSKQERSELAWDVEVPAAADAEAA